MALTIEQAAKLWGISRRRVRQLIAAGRVKVQRVQSSGKRAALVLVLQTERPESAGLGGAPKGPRKGRTARPI